MLQRLTSRLVLRERPRWTRVLCGVRIPSRAQRDWRLLLTWLLLSGGVWGVFRDGVCAAGSARLKNDLVLEGVPVPVMGLTEKTIKQHQGPIPNYPILMIDAGLKWYFVPGKRVSDVNQEAELAKYETFTFKPTLTGRRLTPTSLGAYEEIEDFDAHGHRTVTIRTQFGPVKIVQAITRLTPQYITVKGLTHEWEHGIATTSVPVPILDPILRNATDQSDPLDRLAIARFYLQAGLYLECEAELKSIAEDFPEHADRVAEMREQLDQLIAQRLVRELTMRRNAGQHFLVRAKARDFPQSRLRAEARRSVQELVEDFQSRRQKMEQVHLLLSELQAQLPDDETARAVAPLRSLLRDRLDFEALPRLDAFLNLADAAELTPESKLALAYSGWLLDSANAIEDLSETLRLWQARHLILEYLQSHDGNMRGQLLARIEDIEGISPRRVLDMIPYLPAVRSARDIAPGHAATVTVPDTEPVRAGADEAPDAELPYTVLLPHEYSPHHRYPLIIALAPAERTPAQEVIWWGGTAENPGQSQRHGYIVIAPHYQRPQQQDYDYDVRAHRAVVDSLRDARKRFSIDSDRVFLAGHGMGADAAFDIGLSHPSLFAGVVPICGRADRYCSFYWPNAKHLSWYIVGGELDRDTFEQNARQGQINTMMRMGFDIIYALYIGRGYESYYAEIHRIFDWMDVTRRTTYLSEFEVKTLRPYDNRFYWVEVEGLPRAALESSVIIGDRRRRTSPMMLHARVAPSRSTIDVRTGSDRTTLWLSPELVDFENPVSIRIKGRQRFHDFLQPRLGDILEDLYQRGDRQKLYWTRLSF